MRRVVITGRGVLSPIGNDIKTFTKNLREGNHGIAPITKFDASGHKVKLAAEVQDLDAERVLTKQEMKRMDDFSIYALLAAQQAVDEAKLDQVEDKENIGVYVGSGIGGMHVLLKNHEDYLNKGPNRVSPFFIPAMISNMATGLIAIRFGFGGPTSPIVTACATSTHTIGEAYRNIKDGYSDVILAGGTEASINGLAVAGFSVLQAVTKTEDPNRASIPFDKDRNGFVMGEGAGILVLEEYEHAKKRGAKIFGEILGFGNTCDAHHITAPDPSGRGAARAIREAIGDHAIDASCLYYNAHGTSTPMNDAIETLAIKEVFGEEAYDISISSTKSMTGHTLGAAGAIEALACVFALEEGYIPPTVGTKQTDEECDLDYTLGEGKAKDIEYALSTSLGFGGHNSCLLLKKVHHE